MERSAQGCGTVDGIIEESATAVAVMDSFSVALKTRVPSVQAGSGRHSFSATRSASDFPEEGIQRMNPGASSGIQAWWHQSGSLGSPTARP